MDTARMVERYVKAILRSREALECADPKTRNRQYRIIFDCLRQLDTIGQRHEALVELLTHESPDVRGTAIAHLIKTGHDKAVPVLEKVAEGKGAAGFDAMMVLKLWRCGELHTL